MYSVNVPVPPELGRIAADLAAELERFDRVIRDRTLLVKRLGRRRTRDLDDLWSTVADVLGDWGPIEARTAGIDVFTDPPSGGGPVIYLAVESPGLEAVHAELAAAVGVVNPAVEGDRYVPHVTLARGGNRAAIPAVTGRTVPTLTWTVESVELFDARHRQVVRTLPLPA